jgi:hypothetical protein
MSASFLVVKFRTTGSHFRNYRRSSIAGRKGTAR